MPWSVPDAISGTGLAAAASTISRPLEKFRLAHENSPLCSRAYSPAVSFSSETNAPGGKSLLAQDDFCPGSLAGGQGGEVRGPDRALQPEQQREKQKQPGPEPPAAQQRPQPEKQPVPFLNAEPDPVPAGQPGKLWVTPMRRTGHKPAGLGSNCREMEPILCRGGQQTTGVTVLGREANTGPGAAKGPWPGLLSVGVIGKWHPGKIPCGEFHPAE